jgi:hypothetical protein
MKKADQKQLKAMLGPIAQTWFSYKLKKVQTLFEREISGDLLQSVEQAGAEAARIIAAVEGAIASAMRGDAP